MRYLFFRPAWNPQYISDPFSPGESHALFPNSLHLVLEAHLDAPSNPPISPTSPTSTLLSWYMTYMSFVFASPVHDHSLVSNYSLIQIFPI